MDYMIDLPTCICNIDNGHSGHRFPFCKIFCRRKCLKAIIDASCDIKEGCKLWQGRKTPLGYALRSSKKYRKGLTLHRAIAAMYLGLDLNDTKIYVCHKCDNRNCLEPTHLFLGNHLDNMRDMRNKCRQLLGEKNHRAKLTEEQVRTIKLLSTNDISSKELSKLFGISYLQIYRIRKGLSWKHLE